MLTYYHILSSEITADAGVFRVALNADCEVYQGHFPGEPVCPGVCNIQMIKECTEMLLQGGAVGGVIPIYREPHQEREDNTAVRPGDRTSLCSESPSILLSHIRQCRLTTLVTPLQHPEVEVRVAILSRSEDTITFRGTIGKGEEVYMELKGELTL